MSKISIRILFFRSAVSSALLAVSTANAVVINNISISSTSDQGAGKEGPLILTCNGDMNYTSSSGTIRDRWSSSLIISYSEKKVTKAKGPSPNFFFRGDNPAGELSGEIDGENLKFKTQSNSSTKEYMDIDMNTLNFHGQRYTDIGLEQYTGTCKVHEH